MLLNKINEDYKIAYKQKELTKISTLRTLKGELARGVEKPENLSDSKIVSIIQGIVKSSKETYNIRPEEKLLEEIKILESYIPETLDKVATAKIIEQAMVALDIQSIKDMGKIMKFLDEAYGAKIDKTFASSFIKTRLM